MAVDFTNFTQSTTIPTSAYFVGYEKNESGGERRWSYGTLRSELSAQIGPIYPTGGGTNKVFFENDQTVTSDYTITAGKNAMSCGPITVNNGVTLTVPSGSTYTIV